MSAMETGTLHWQREGKIWTLQRYATPLLRISGREPVATTAGWRIALAAGDSLLAELPLAQHWYGQGAFIRQAFPLDRLSLPVSPLQTWDNGPQGHGCVQEALWLASNGVALFAPEPREALSVGINPRGPKQEAEWVAMDARTGSIPPELAAPAERRLELLASEAVELELRVGEGLAGALRAALPAIGHPETLPPEALLSAPTWTTWAMYKSDIDESRVLELARAIRAHGYPGATLEIDDRWQRAYGDTTFDPLRFPDPAGLVEKLAEMGFATTLWTTPFLAPDSLNGREAASRGFVLADSEGRPQNVRWWQGEAWLLDLSQKAARAWWVDKLAALQRETGIAGYKFDAGEANFLPANALPREPIEASAYSHLWAQLAARHFPYGEARCGWHNQREAILFRQWDKFSTWGEDNGLASVITGALSLGLVGYPFVLPDMIGGNAYGNSVSAELMIRWTQACAPMLAIQFSIPPWSLGDDAERICRDYANLHVELAPQRLAAARQAAVDGTPPLKPMAWVAGADADALAIADQYLVGDDLLVAPVLVEGARCRDIWLPPGTWREQRTGKQFSGGWLREHPAPLDHLPLFWRMS
ncbi:TIM-barrel domain-containing protein [Niveibacterium terrae]|uniref:TIM-barrel domain-containing protein n=1 Tax=Niveibacterium terrae TaxID=3373598 RepID=UPI003A8DBEFB